MKLIIIAILIVCASSLSVNMKARFRRHKTQNLEGLLDAATKIADEIKNSWFIFYMGKGAQKTAYTEVDIVSAQRCNVWAETFGLVFEPLVIPGQEVVPPSSFGGGIINMKAAKEAFELFNQYQAIGNGFEKHREEEKKRTGEQPNDYNRGIPTAFENDPTKKDNGEPYHELSGILPWRLVSNCDTFTSQTETIEIPYSLLTKPEEEYAKLKFPEASKPVDPNAGGFKIVERPKKSFTVTGLYDMKVIDGGQDYEIFSGPDNKVKYDTYNLVFSVNQLFKEFPKTENTPCKGLIDPLKFWAKQLPESLFHLNKLNKNFIQLAVFKKKFVSILKTFIKKFDKFMTYISIEGISTGGMDFLNSFKKAADQASQLDSMDPYAENIPYDLLDESKIDQFFVPLGDYVKKNVNVFSQFNYLGDASKYPESDISIAKIEEEISKIVI